MPRVPKAQTGEEAPRQENLPPRSRNGTPVQVPGQAGEEADLVGALRRAWGVNRKIFSRLTGYSERALAEWESGKALTEAARKRLVEVQRLHLRLARVMDPGYLGRWLEQPNPAFGGFKPLELIERGEVDRIWEMVFKLESGAPR
jgi:hypothetical protein